MHIRYFKNGNIGIRTFCYEKAEVFANFGHFVKKVTYRAQLQSTGTEWYYCHKTDKFYEITQDTFNQFSEGKSAKLIGKSMPSLKEKSIQYKDIKENPSARELYFDGYEDGIIDRLQEDVDGGYRTEDEAEYLKQHMFFIVTNMYKFFKENPHCTLGEELDELDGLMDQLVANRK